MDVKDTCPCFRTKQKKRKTLFLVSMEEVIIKKNLTAT